MINWTGDEEESHPLGDCTQKEVEGALRRVQEQTEPPPADEHDVWSASNVEDAYDIAREFGSCNVLDAKGEVRSVISIPRNVPPTEDSLLEEIAGLKASLVQAQQGWADAKAQVAEWQKWLGNGCDGETLTKMGEMRVQIRQLERQAATDDKSFDDLNDEACSMFRALHRILEPDCPHNIDLGLDNLFKEVRVRTEMVVEDLQREQGCTGSARAAEHFARGAALRQSREEGPAGDDEMILSIDSHPPERCPVTNERLYCDECYKPQYRTPHGIVCTNGHGGAPGSIKDA